MSKVTDEMVEAAAKAICIEWGYEWDGDPEDSQTAPETDDENGDAPSKELYRCAARAALIAAAKADADAEITRLLAEVAALRLSLGEHVPDATVEPVGCPAPGACMTVAEITRLRARVKWLERVVTPDEELAAKIAFNDTPRKWNGDSPIYNALAAARAARLEPEK